MSDDLVKRLEDTAQALAEDGVTGIVAGCREAAKEIERLRAEVARLVKSRNKWGQKYNETLEKLKAAVWADSEYVKEVDKVANAAIVARDEAIREVSRLGRELGATQALLTEAVEVVREIEKWLAKPEWGTWPYTEGDGLYNDHSNAERTIHAFLAKLEGR